MGSNESIVITGGKGMLAQALLRELQRRGQTALAVERAACDITSAQDVRKLFDSAGPTLLINCAAHTKVDLCEDEPEKADAINGVGPGHLAAAAKSAGATLVHFSTDFVFDGTGDRPYRADDPTRPLSAYGRSKLLGEQAIQSSGLGDWLILRTAWLYGRGGPNFPRTMIERGRQGAPLKVVGDQVGAPTYTVDLAEATLDLLERGARGVFHVTNGGSTSWHDFARAALEDFEVPAALSPLSTAEWLKLRPKQAHRPAYSVLDLQAAEKALGRPMRPWREGLRAFRAEVDQFGSF